ncbi:hypothetical protein BKA81DRAFT_407998 [Phyllosticta paracitricarpa]|uniref:Uncharacterized protein n=2 Tax=Phyllosticta TaxID=121621 RepID=A0ABR1LH67_9PEZI
MWMAFFGAGDCNGFVQEYLVRDEPMKLPAPTNVSLVEAAAYATAWLTSYDSLSKGSMAAGATATATSSFDQKLEFVKKIGAKHSINYGKAPNWTEETL